MKKISQVSINCLHFRSLNITDSQLFCLNLRLIVFSISGRGIVGYRLVRYKINFPPWTGGGIYFKL